MGGRRLLSASKSATNLILVIQLGCVFRGNSHPIYVVVFLGALRLGGQTGVLELSKGLEKM